MAAWFIDDFDQTRIYVTDSVRQWFIPKFRIYMTVTEPYLYLHWNDREQGDGGSQRLLVFNFNDVVDSYSGYVDNPSSAADLMNQIEAMIISGWTSIGVGGDILLNKGDILTHNGTSDVIHPAGPDRSLVGYDSTSSDGLSNYTPAQVLANANGVVGPGSSTNNNIPLFDGATGKLLKDSGKAFSTDGTLAGNSDTLIPTQKAVKTYVDGKLVKTFAIGCSAFWNPADAIEYAFDGTFIIPQNGNYANRGIFFPVNITIIGCHLNYKSTSAAGHTGENISLYLRLNNTTDALVATLGNTSNIKKFTNMALSIAVTTADYITPKFAATTWVTNPVSVGLDGTIYYI